MTFPKTYRKLTAVQSAASLRDAVQIQEVPLEMPSDGNILVKTMYAGVNAADYLMAVGRYLAPTPPPFDLGAEAVGQVVAVGAGVTHLKEGDFVFALSGGYREYFTLPAAYAVPLPHATREVVALGVAGLTASIALEEVGQMRDQETVLVTAAAGGTGTFVVQLAKLAGNHVIGTCGSDDKADFLRSLGCDRPINYRRETLSEVLKNEYRKGISLIFESVGGATFDACLNALAVHGRMIVIGAISEYETGPEIVTRPRVIYSLLNKSASLRGFWLMNFMSAIPQHLGKLMGLVMGGQLQVAVDATVFNGVEEAVSAIEYLYAGKNIGKVVVNFV